MSFQRGDRPSYGLVRDDGVVDVGVRLAARYPDLRAVIASDAVEELALAADGRAADLPLAEVDFLPVIPNPDKILCVGRNFAAHADEIGEGRPEHPRIWIKLPSALVGHEHDMIKPSVTEQFDFEGEPALVIGKGGRYIEEAEAFAHIAGWSLFNDGSARDWIAHSVNAGKNFPHSTPFGPVLVTPDEMPDLAAITLRTRLNGTEVQRATLDEMLFSVPYLVRYCSTMVELMPGDVITLGTPAGVGQHRTPPLWLKDGDVLEVEMDGVGVLRNRVVAESG